MIRACLVAEVLKTLASFMAHYPDTPLIVVGDYNNLLDSHWDKMSSNSPNLSSLGKAFLFSLVGELGLIDMWRLMHPTTKMFSCHSAAYDGLSRIDLGLGNRSVLSLLVDSHYEPRHVSDHSPFWVELALPTTPQHFSWKLNPFWLTLIPDPDPIPELLTSFFLYNIDSADIGMVWDTAKAFLRGQFIHIIQNIKTSIKKGTQFF